MAEKPRILMTTNQPDTDIISLDLSSCSLCFTEKNHGQIQQQQPHGDVEWTPGMGLHYSYAGATVHSLPKGHCLLFFAQSVSVLWMEQNASSMVGKDGWSMRIMVIPSPSAKGKHARDER